MTANLSRLLEWHRVRRGEREALVYGERRTTWVELDELVDALARGLRGLGVGDGDRVGILALNSDRYVAALLAVAKLGAVYVPLNVRLSPPELAAMIDEAEIRVCFAGPEHAELAAAAGERADSGLAHVVVLDGPAGDRVGFEELLAGAPAGRLPHAEKGLGDLQRIQYSSGTTSRPKGVEITHGQVIWNFHTMIMEVGMSGEDRVLLSPPLYHAGGLDIPGLTTLYVGATWIVNAHFRSDELLAAIAAERPTGVYLVSPVIEEVLEALAADGRTVDEVRWIMSGGLVPETIERTHAAFPNGHVIQGYGMTETLGGMVYMDTREHPGKLAAQGLPVRHLDVRVTGPNGEELPAGEVGQVRVRGAKVSPGYWRDAEKTAASHADGWLLTGDLARFDADGYLYFVGREKDMIKTGGENVALAEIERVLLAHPAVAEVCAIGVPDPRWTEVPKAFVVAAGGELDFAELEAHCAERLAKFKVPRRWEQVAELPWNHSGKVVRSVLVEREAARGGEQ